MKNEIYKLDDLPFVLDINGLCKALGIGRSSAYALVRSGQVASVRVGNKIRIPRPAVMQFLSIPGTEIGA